MKSIFKSIFIFVIAIVPILIQVHVFNQNQNLVDAPVIFSFEELGYETTTVKESHVSKYKNSKQEEVNLYSLRLSSGLDKESSVGLTMDLYECEDANQSRELFEELLRARKDFRNEITCKGTCYHPAATFESATADMYQLDEDEWGIDLGFSSIDYHNIPDNLVGSYEVFILKDDCVLELLISKEINLDAQKIEAMMNVFDRTEQVFE